jgi:hypothetical protein
MGTDTYRSGNVTLLNWDVRVSLVIYLNHVVENLMPPPVYTDRHCNDCLAIKGVSLSRFFVSSSSVTTDGIII